MRKLIKGKWGVYSAIVVAMVFWSLSFIWYKEAYRHINPITTIFFRLLVSSVILMVWAFIAKKLSIKRSHLKLFFMAAFFEPFMYFLGESFGMKYVSPITASVIISVIPLLTPVAASLFFREQLAFINVIGMVISFVGVMLVLLGNDAHFQASMQGVLLMLIAVVAALGYTIALRKLTPMYEPLTIVAVQNTIGTILFAPLFLIFDFPSLSGEMLQSAWLPIVKLAVFASSISFICYAFGVMKIGASRVNVFTNLIPVLTAVFAFFILNESITMSKIAGIVIVVAGLFLSQVNSWMMLKKTKN